MILGFFGGLLFWMKFGSEGEADKGLRVFIDGEMER